MASAARRALGQRWTLWLAALWWGSLTTTGFGVVPLLFANLPTPSLAGAMAAKLFAAQTWVAVVCGMGLLLAATAHAREPGEPTQPTPSIAAAQRTLAWVALGMVLALLSEFAVAPRIVARENLVLWHSLGSGMYLMQWVCAAMVLGRWAHRPQAL